MMKSSRQEKKKIKQKEENIIKDIRNLFKLKTQMSLQLKI